MESVTREIEPWNCKKNNKLTGEQHPAPNLILFYSTTTQTGSTFLIFYFLFKIEQKGKKKQLNTRNSYNTSLSKIRNYKYIIIKKIKKKVLK